MSTKRLNEQVRRNPTRFPADFAFQTTRDKYGALRSQIATLKEGRGEHRKYLPWAFAEHGALMAANVLNSPRAVQMSELERRVAGHDEDLRAIVQTIRRLVAPPDTPQRRIGFRGGAR